MSEHYDRERDQPRNGATTAGRVAEAGRQAIAKAMSSVRDRVERAGDYAHELTGSASKKITDVTGQTPDAWVLQFRRLVEQSPIRALVVAIAAGFVVGRVMRHG